ncbi:MAG: SDR family oxidoreductase [Planctomycetaceae bacterium]|nr:SDR family oxidoreductase [Planctomycetaceae bacterium]
MKDAPETRVVLMTGVTRGLGRAMVSRFCESGCLVLGCGRSAEGIAALQQECGDPHRFAAVDVSREEDVRRWAESLLKDGLVPDLLLNNAAVINSNAPLWEVPTDEFATVLNVNVLGTYHVLRHFLPAMVTRKRGVIVNFSSGWGRSVSAEVAPYCASKWAIEGLTQALAEELPAGMAAVPLNPGIIDTDMLRSCFGDAAGSYLSADRWSRRAAPYLLSLGPQHNGRPLTAPGGE